MTCLIITKMALISGFIRARPDDGVISQVPPVKRAYVMGGLKAVSRGSEMLI